MSKRYYSDIYLDDISDNSFLKYFKPNYYQAIMEDENAGPAPAVEISKQYLASARYRGQVRERMPGMLANGYLAIKKSFANEWGLNAHSQLEVRTNNDNANELFRWEPVFNAAAVIGNATLSSTAWTFYDEFRIRAVRVSLSSEDYNVNNSAHLQHYIWWVGNHQEYDVESATEMVTYRQLLSCKNAGENIQQLGSRPDAGFSMAYVPQVVMQEDSVLSADVAYQDTPVPWMRTTDAAKNIAMRGPIFIWRKPYRDVADDTLLAKYNVNYTCVIEFRNLDTNKA